MAELISTGSILIGALISVFIYLFKTTADLRIELNELKTILTLKLPEIVNKASRLPELATKEELPNLVSELIKKEMTKFKLPELVSKEELSELITSTAQKTIEEASRRTEVKVDLGELLKETVEKVHPAVRAFAGAGAGFYSFMAVVFIVPVEDGYSYKFRFLMFIVSLLCASLLWAISIFSQPIFAKIKRITKINLFPWKSSIALVLSITGVW